MKDKKRWFMNVEIIMPIIYDDTAKELPLKKRAHYDLRIAHANGAEIEMKISNNTWMEITNPSFVEDIEYRIKPKEDRIFPTTTLSGESLAELLKLGTLSDDCITIANMAIKQYILDRENQP